MDKRALYSAVILALSMAVTAGLYAQLSQGYRDFQPDNTIQEDYYASLADYFGMATEKVLDIQEKGIPDEEVAVALFIVSNSYDTGKPAKLEDVIGLRKAGKSWMDITLQLGLTTDIYYFPVDGYLESKPFGSAYKKFFDTSRKKWKTVRLNDNEIVNLVNLRFLSRYYELTAAEVIALCEKEPKFMVVNREIRRGKDMEWILERMHHEKEK